jgi:hypothetical protein
MSVCLSRLLPDPLPFFWALRCNRMYSHPTSFALQTSTMQELDFTNIALVAPRQLASEFIAFSSARK